MPHIRRALISVSDKRGLIEFAKALQRMGVEIISTGGTHGALKEHGISTDSVSDVTNFPEILDGRVKTLHPKIHAGLLALADNEHHSQQLKDHDIEAIDMVVVNLYPFEQTVSRNGVPIDEAMEQVDIGGPALIRSAVKNFKNKVVIANPDRYSSIIEEMEANNGSVSETTCFALAKEVFRHTSSYDAVIAGYLDHVSQKIEGFSPSFHLSLTKQTDLRYGENPHQRAALYGDFGSFFHNFLQDRLAALVRGGVGRQTVA